jgi:toxin ParE1/3/4
MARIELAPGIKDDFDRILGHLRAHDATNAHDRIHEIIHAIDVLATNPMIGRLIDRRMRELIIGRDHHGYVALYRYILAIDTVFVLAIRAQREAGYAR